MTPQVGICSAGRPEVCAFMTVAMLLRGGVPPSSLSVFVPDASSAEDYAANLSGVSVQVAPHDPYDRQLPTPDHPGLGLATARNTALDMLSAQKQARWLWWFDDDISALRTLDPGSRKPRARNMTDIAGWMLRLEEQADHYGATLIGIQPNANPLNFHNTATIGLTFCIGQCYAVRSDTAIRGWLTEKDDYERSLQHFTLGGGAYRANNVGAASKVYSGAGGLQLSRTFERSHAEAAWLVERWPSFIRINERRTLPVDQGRAELLLRVQRSNLKVPIAVPA